MDQSLRRKLDRITDILWAGGVTNPVTYIEQISYLILTVLGQPLDRLVHHPQRPVRGS